MDLILISLLFVIVFASPSLAWNYKEQDEWPSVFCQKAVAQSPINLQPGTMTKVKTARLRFTNWNNEYNVTLSNSGKTIQVDIPSQSRMSLSGGGLPGTFNIVQFHFHWGSEHAVNGQRLALEIHFVGFNDKYESFDEALNYTNGIAVLAVLYKYSGKTNTGLQPIIQQIENLRIVNQMTNILLNPAYLLPRDVRNFYRYDGSLTTPDCNDVVVWTIFRDLNIVTKYQVDQFRTIMSSEGDLLLENVRKLQPLNGRTVYKIFT